MDTSDSMCICIGKIIPRNLRLVASRLSRTAVTRPTSRAAITHFHWGMQVAFYGVVAFILVLAVSVTLVKVQQCLCTTSLAGDSVLRHFDMECSCQFVSLEEYPGVIQSQLSHCYTQEPHLPALSLLKLRPVDDWSAISIRLSQHLKTHLWPFWSYSSQWACQTVPGVPDLIALP